MNPRFNGTVAARRPQGFAPAIGWTSVLVWVLLVALAAPSTADAQRKKRRSRRGKNKPAPTAPAKPDTTPKDQPRTGPATPGESDSVNLAGDADGDDGDTDGDGDGANVRMKGESTQVFDFTGMNLSGSERKPQLLYFLDRAQEELKRASLERRSFVPEMVRSVDEEAL